MIVLGLDTATRATAVGLMLADGRVLQARDDPDGEQRPGHATRLLPLAHRLLHDARLGWREIERIAVGVGPGTFTGLRIGVASARGLAQSLGVDLVGVSSLRALAHAAYADTPEETGGVSEGTGGVSEETGGVSEGTGGVLAETGGVSEGTGGVSEGTGGVLAVIDARRGEAFAAAYHGDVELLAPQPLSPAELAELREHAHALTGVRRWTALGDGAVRYRDELVRAGVLVPADRSPLHLVDARAICELGAGAAPEEGRVLPDYRRRPDAELALEGAPS